MRSHDAIDALQLARMFGGHSPDTSLNFLTPEQRACTTRQSYAVHRTGFSDLEIAEACGLSPAQQTRYVNAIQSWQDFIYP